jgi:hypothetical protein
VTVQVVCRLAAESQAKQVSRRSLGRRITNYLKVPYLTYLTLFGILRFTSDSYMSAGALESVLGYLLLFFITIFTLVITYQDGIVTLVTIYYSAWCASLCCSLPLTMSNP